MAYISGQVASRPNGEPVPDNLVEQTKIVAANAKAALDALGATPEDVVIARIFMTDLNSHTLDQAFPVLLDMFGGAQPCITGVGVAALAGPGLKIEMEMTVRLPD
jgi:enamine deaminase RidA (YjgF/YER057c/UK114 family)